MRLSLVAIILIALVSPVFSLTPDELLADPALEARARAISSELRCLVCQNQTIDDSDAPLARDLRAMVRERILAGRSDDDIIAAVTDRYGDFVLFRPRFAPQNYLLWLSPFLLLAIGLFTLWRILRQTRS
jgi:cytochrome c-type biogenesis protein CcmH